MLTGNSECFSSKYLGAEFCDTGAHRPYSFTASPHPRFSTINSVEMLQSHHWKCQRTNQCPGEEGAVDAVLPAEALLLGTLQPGSSSKGREESHDFSCTSDNHLTLIQPKAQKPGQIISRARHSRHPKCLFGKDGSNFHILGKILHWKQLFSAD